MRNLAMLSILWLTWLFKQSRFFRSTVATYDYNFLLIVILSKVMHLLVVGFRATSIDK